MEKTLGQYLLFELEKSDYTQAQFARKMNISKSSLNKYIQDERQIPLDLLVKFAFELKFSIDEIFNLNFKDGVDDLTVSEYTLIKELRKLEINKKKEIIMAFVKIIEQVNE